jgi:hypothetical protein
MLYMNNNASHKTKIRFDFLNQNLLLLLGHSFLSFDCVPSDFYPFGKAREFLQEMNIKTKNELICASAYTERILYDHEELGKTTQVLYSCWKRSGGIT